MATTNLLPVGQRHGPVGKAGFSLVELLVTLSVMAILLAIAVPSFSGIVASNRAVAASNEFIATLNFARSEAIKRGTPVTICKTADPNIASPACSTSANWQGGWVVFTDGNTAGSIDGSDTRLRIGQPSGGNPTLTGDSNYSNYVTYLPNGSSIGNGGSVTGNLTLCVSGNRRIIHISATGRTQVTSGGVLMDRLRTPNNQSGASLIEVLVSIVIMSLGLLGYAGLLLKTQQSNTSAYNRSQATILAYDVVERMRANRALAVDSGGYNIAIGSNTGSGIAGTDLADWKASLTRSLPGGDGSVTVDNQGNVTIVVQWLDNRNGTPTSFATQTNI